MAQQQDHPRRNFRARRDILEELSDAELLKRYRFDREGIMFITDLVRDELQSPTNRNVPITPEMKVLMTLRYLATGKMQQCNSDDLGPSQPSVSNSITQTLHALTAPHLIKQFIKFPALHHHELARIAGEFRQVAGFPGVVGVIDGTHIRIIAPRRFEAEYVNRKNYHSVNVQIVFDAAYNILNVVAKWPGSTHDARIWQESCLRMLFEHNRVPPGYHLLGDSGYPCKPYLLTPFLRPQPGPQANYNMAHKRTRNIVERGIGQLKRRFHVLHGEVRVSPAKTYRIVGACAILHNICKARNIEIPADIDNLDEVVYAAEDDPIPFAFPATAHQAGLQYRDAFANTHFKSRSRSQLPLPLPAHEDPAAIPPVGVEETGVKVVQFSGVANTSESLALYAGAVITRVLINLTRRKHQLNLKPQRPGEEMSQCERGSGSVMVCEGKSQEWQYE
ncbi:hypothetical protein Pcinc_009105 [Petrolisthes cinctipes]|uniref:Putative nuclease HARBI1 n=1 Tax=Petrolisthes cinctipes TaxID=88211 RepID=A0AAE1G647_PETCI|nr:hypothetical protein Pcinc_009105 [Petrolisthes cinctipes]